MLTFFIENNFACDKFGDAIRLASTDNRRSKRAALRRMLSFIFAARNKPVEGAVRRSPALYRMPSWLRGPLPGLRFQRDSQTRPHCRVRNREKRTRPRVPRSRATTRDLWGFARIYVCSGRRVWLPRPHPRRVTCGTVPSEPDVPDVPVRFDRRSIIVKSFAPFLLPASHRGFTRVAGACESSITIGRSIDRSIDRRKNSFLLSFVSNR